MRVLICTFALAALASPIIGATAEALTPERIVRSSLQNHRYDYLEATQHYTYLQRDEQHDGTNKSTVSEVTAIHGVPYERTISRNGATLPPELEAKERTKLDRRENETPEQQAKRRRDYEHAMDFLNEVPEAFIFKMLPGEDLDGRANYVIQCLPKPGFHANIPHAAMFSHIQAKMWVDKEDLQWRKAEARVVGAISIGWIVARVEPGAVMILEQKRISSRDWLTASIDVNGDAKVLLVKNHPIHERITCFDFKPVPPQSAGNISKLQGRH